MDEHWVIAYILLFYILIAVSEKPSKHRRSRGGIIVNRDLPVKPVSKPMPPRKKKTVRADGFEDETREGWSE